MLMLLLLLLHHQRLKIDLRKRTGNCMLILWKFFWKPSLCVALCHFIRVPWRYQCIVYERNTKWKNNIEIVAMNSDALSRRLKCKCEMWNVKCIWTAKRWKFRTIACVANTSPIGIIIFIILCIKTVRPQSITQLIMRMQPNHCAVLFGILFFFFHVWFCFTKKFDIEHSLEAMPSLPYRDRTSEKIISYDVNWSGAIVVVCMVDVRSFIFPHLFNFFFFFVPIVMLLRCFHLIILISAESILCFWVGLIRSFHVYHTMWVCVSVFVSDKGEKKKKTTNRFILTWVKTRIATSCSHFSIIFIVAVAVVVSWLQAFCMNIHSFSYCKVLTTIPQIKCG